MAAMWTDMAIARAISFVPIVVGLYVMINSYSKHQFRHQKYWIIAIVWGMVMYIFSLLAFLYNSMPFQIINMIMNGGLYGLYFYNFEIMKGEKFSPTVLFIYGFLAGGYYQALTEPGAMSADLLPVGALNVWNNILISYFFCYFFVFYVILYRESPPSLKRSLKITLILIVMLMIGIVVISVSNIGNLNKQILMMLLLSSILTMMYICWAIKPEIGYVLPFKALRLVVMDTNAGIALFSYTWQGGKKMVDVDLFGGMLQGVGLIIKESVGQGNVQDIILDEGVLIVHRAQEFPIACVVITTKSSRALRDALLLFTTRFITKFKNVLSIIDDVSPFAQTKDLVKECFPFVPE